MPLRSTGNLIKKIKFNKNNIVLVFDDEKVSISKDAYSMNYLYVGKELSKKEIQQLIDFSSLDKALSYAMSLLRRQHYSEYRIREKLYAKEYEKKDIDNVIKFLKRNDLINDEMFAFDYIEYANEKCFGKHRIINELKDKGIFDETINRLKFPESMERKKALELLKKLEKKNENLSYDKSKQKIYASLIQYGFDHHMASEVIEKMKDKNEKNENKNLKKDFDKLYLRLSSKYEDKELIDKLYKGLKNKGYRYSDIKKIMEDKFHEIY